MTHEIDLIGATVLATERVRLFERESGRVLVLGAPRAHEIGWSFSYSHNGEVLLGAPLILVTKTRRIYEIYFPFDVERFVAQVLDGGKNNLGDEPPIYQIADE